MSGKEEMVYTDKLRTAYLYLSPEALPLFMRSCRPHLHTT